MHLNFQPSLGLIQVIPVRSVAVEFIAVIHEEKEVQVNQSAAVMCGFYKQGSAGDITECIEFYHISRTKHYTMAINKMFIE